MPVPPGIASRFARILWEVCAILFHAGIPKEALSHWAGLPNAPTSGLSPGTCGAAPHACGVDSLGSGYFAFALSLPKGAPPPRMFPRRTTTPLSPGTCGAAVAPYGAVSLGSGCHTFFTQILPKGAPPPKAAETGYACALRRFLSLRSDSLGSVYHAFSRTHPQ